MVVRKYYFNSQDNFVIPLFYFILLYFILCYFILFYFINIAIIREI